MSESVQQKDQHAKKQVPKWVSAGALISGVLGMLLFIITPFLPVNQVQSSFEWPQQNTLNSINAPLESYTPQEFQATIPVKESIKDLREGQNLILGTLPVDSEKATARGFFVRSYDGGIEVITRGIALLKLSKDDVSALPADADITVTSSNDAGINVTIPGTDFAATADGESHPELTGIYTELNAENPKDFTELTNAGLNVDVEVNSRFTSSPTLLKKAAMYLGGILMLFSLFCLFKIDRFDGRGHIRTMHKNEFRPTLLDTFVGGVLGFWYIFGGNTSDDGFILTMARASTESTYMANYYRWFGVPESPFGAPYYDLLALMTRVATNSMWMRLPSLICALLIWFLISRKALPFLGEKIAKRKVAKWTSALMFLAFWLAFNNGLRPEPVVALGALATWVLFERALATKRLLPAALGTIVAAFTLACGPTGLMAVAALLACLGGVLRIMYKRIPTVTTGTSRMSLILGWLTLLAPFFAAGTAVLVAVFGDQTWATVLESIRVRSEVGPALPWYAEYSRYVALFTESADGSFARRAPFLFMLVALVFVLASTLRNGKVVGSNSGPANRLVFIIMATLFALTFTPTKWTHHFGIFAGLGAVLGGLAAVAVAQFVLRNTRSRVLVIGIFTLIFAFAFSSSNSWWYVSSFSIPWFDKSIQIGGLLLSNIVLAIAVIVLVITAFLFYLKDIRAGEPKKKSAPSRGRRLFTTILSAPIALACAFAVFLSVASFAKGFVDQYPAYSIGLGNVDTLRGQSCSLADAVLVETNTNDSFLTPVNSSLGESLDYVDSQGFTPSGIEKDLINEIPGTSAATSEISQSTDGPATNSDTAQSTVDTTSTTGTADEKPTNTENVDSVSGNRTDRGINGSTTRLPFEIDYTKVPVLGSYSEEQQVYAENTSDWYSLPAEKKEDAPLLVVSAAGRIGHDDINGVWQDGQDFFIEYGEKLEDGTVAPLGETRMIDIGPKPGWRNLRLPLSELPDNADVVRIHATDSNLDEDEWIAFTPPRVPTMDTLNNFIGSEAPGLLDWEVALQFPCQRPFSHYAGIAERPEYRVTPDAAGEEINTIFQNHEGGGIMGPAEAVNFSYKLPTYLKDDWVRDWGSLERVRPRTNSLDEDPTPVELKTEVITRSGLWTPGEMNIETDKE